MSFGKMNGFADIISVKRAKDSEGFSSSVDEILASVRVYREGRHGSQRWANLATFSEATDLFRFRVIPGIAIISFSRVVNGSGISDLLVTTPNGNVFKNDEVATLIAKAELWRGSTLDTTNISYKWAMMDSSVTSTTSSGYDAAFGTGWRKLSDTNGKYTGTSTNTVTIYAAAVSSYAVVKCIATDTDTTSATYDSSFMDVATFIDNSDPLQIIITSTGGDVFKNGEGSTVLTAVCYQAGVKMLFKQPQFKNAGDFMALDRWLFLQLASRAETIDI